ncbi:MAG: IS3 family transposase [Prevotella sp.]|nr:IS3 family transposase [Prevotella sp.]
MAICELSGVSRQSYYRKKWSSARQKDRAGIVVQSVEKIRAEMPRVGCRKLYHMLHPQMRSLSVGRDKLFTILRANHMLVSPVRSYHVTTNSHHRFRKHKNLVEGMEINRPEQVWVSDITYIGGRDKHMYLALVTDAYSKKIVGYDLSESLNTEGALRALRMAHASRIYKNEPLIHHSDRGIQYCSDAYQKRLARYGMTTSMTESYDPYANAVAERVNGILKQEFLLEEINLPLDGMKLVIRDAVNTYNKVRPHYSCGYMTPCQMHSQRTVRMKTYKKKKIIAGLVLQ